MISDIKIIGIDKQPLRNKNFHDKVFDKLFVDEIYLMTKLRKNMKKKAIEFMDKFSLEKEQLLNL